MQEAYFIKGQGVKIKLKHTLRKKRSKRKNSAFVYNLKKFSLQSLLLRFVHLGSRTTANEDIL